MFQYKISSVVDNDVKEHQTDPAYVMGSFDSLNPELRKVLDKMNFHEPTQVQRW